MLRGRLDLGDMIDRAFSLPTSDILLLRSSFETSLARTPLYFGASMICFCFLGFAYRDHAPLWLTVFLPAAVFSLAALRLLYWLTIIAPRATDAELPRLLRALAVEALLLVSLLAAWPLMLFSYADTALRFLTIFNFALVTLICIYCMLHMRMAIMASLLITPASISYLAWGHEGPVRIAFIGIFTTALATTIHLVLRYKDEFSVLTYQRNDLKRLSDENFRMANVDSLTGLANRRRFFSDLATKRTPSDMRPFAVAILDLDGFKPINDAHGHVAGDAALRIIGERIEKLCAGRARPYRLGGDEFGILIEGQDDDERLMAFAREVIERLSEPFSVNAVKLAVGASIGFACFPFAARSAGELYERADYALYRSKRCGRGRAVIFNADHERELREGIVIENAMKTADIEREFYLLFQPIVNSRTGRILAFECLARWESPMLGRVSPARFVPVAEHSGVITRLTTALLRKALAAAKEWPPEVRMSFNISAVDACTEGQAEALIAIVRESGIEPARVEFELTETAITSNYAVACANMQALRAFGSKVALDDFGTGFSSLSHVHLLPLDKIKIDRSFVRDVECRGTSHKIIKSLSLLCKDMGLDCVAEGVEMQDQVETLAEIGCDVIQGYYYAKPMREAMVPEFLAAPRAAGGKPSRAA